MTACALCAEPGGRILVDAGVYRIVAVDDPAFPGFTRVIWNAHVAEMTDLHVDARAQLMAAVWRVEAVMREVLQPDKVNLASLGNVVPHLHWHVIARWREDTHFPQPIWAQAQRTGAPPVSAARVAAYEAALKQAFARAAANA